MDMLEHMMLMQERLNQNVKKKMPELKDHFYDEPIPKGLRKLIPEDDHRRHWIDRFASALIAEVVETREAAHPYQKWWRNKTKDMDGVKEEIVDCFHFLMSMALASGMDASELHRRYLEKNKNNLVRQDWDINKNEQQS